MKINATKLWLFVTMSTAAGLWASERVRAKIRIAPNEAVGKAKQLMQADTGRPQPTAQNSAYDNIRSGGDPLFYSVAREIPRRATGPVRSAKQPRLFATPKATMRNRPHRKNLPSY